MESTGGPNIMSSKAQESTLVTVRVGGESDTLCLSPVRRNAIRVAICPAR